MPVEVERKPPHVTLRCDFDGCKVTFEIDQEIRDWRDVILPGGVVVVAGGEFYKRHPFGLNESCAARHRTLIYCTAHAKLIIPEERA